MIEKISTLYNIIDKQADIIDAYRALVDRRNIEEELELIEIQKKENLVAALRETVGCAP